MTSEENIIWSCKLQITAEENVYIYYAPQKSNYLRDVVQRKTLISINTAVETSDLAKQNLIMCKVTSGSPSNMNICSVCQVPLLPWYRIL